MEAARATIFLDDGGECFVPGFPIRGHDGIFLELRNRNLYV